MQANDDKVNTKEKMEKFAKVGTSRKLWARMMGGDICPICGQMVVPYEEDGFWRMECTNVKCLASANIESDFCDTKCAAREAYRRAVSLFVNLNKLTCKCEKCGGEVKGLVFYKMLAKPNSIHCVNCGKGVNEATELECVREWNVKNHSENDKAFIEHWKTRNKYEAGLNKFSDELEYAKKVKHRGG